MKVNFQTTIGSIVSASGGSIIYGDPNMEIDSVTTDSRELGEKSLFIPLIGERFDGHQFIQELVRKKEITAFLTMKEEFCKIAEEYGVSAILCDDTLKAYGGIASNHRLTINPYVIGVTGTNGKTTTKELIWSVLNRIQKSLKNEKNYNNEVGVPYTLLGLKKEHRYAVIEMGMNHKGEIDSLSRIVRPDIAIITNIGEGHLEYLGSIEAVAYAKSEILNGMKNGSLIFLNKDSECYELLYTKAQKFGVNTKSYGLSDNADIFPDSYEIFKDHLSISYLGELYKTGLYGIHNLYNALAAIAVALELGIQSSSIKDALLDIISVDKRSEILDNDFLVINDTYNSNPLSSKYALMSAKKIFPDRRKIAVLSDMKELGDFSEFYHSQLGRQVYEYGFDMLCAWGDMAKSIADGAARAGMDSKKIFFFATKNELIDFLVSNIRERDVVLIKGSRSMKMEDVVDSIIH